jgi:heterodisulfide reductase subunit C
VVSALKEIAEREGERNKDAAYEKFFLEQIRDNGRIAELPLTGQFLLVFPQGAVQSMQMGLELITKGKIGLETERIMGRDEVKRIVEELRRA